MGGGCLSGQPLKEVLVIEYLVDWLFDWRIPVLCFVAWMHFVA